MLFGDQDSASLEKLVLGCDSQTQSSHGFHMVFPFPSLVPSKYLFHNAFYLLVHSFSLDFLIVISVENLRTKEK